MFALEAGTIAAWAAVATVGIYIFLAFYAARQVKEARTLREQQTRPFVVAEFVPDFIIGFRLRNLGTTLGRNVRVQWDTWPEITKGFSDDPLWQSPENSVLFSSGIPTLAPNQEISTLFDKFPDRAASDLPMAYVVTVTYDNFDGSKHYEESTRWISISTSSFGKLGLREPMRSQRS